MVHTVHTVPLGEGTEHQINRKAAGRDRTPLRRNSLCSLLLSDKCAAYPDILKQALCLLGCTDSEGMLQVCRTASFLASQSLCDPFVSCCLPGRLLFKRYPQIGHHKHDVDLNLCQGQCLLFTLVCRRDLVPVVPWGCCLTVTSQLLSAVAGIYKRGSSPGEGSHRSSSSTRVTCILPVVLSLCAVPAGHASSLERLSFSYHHWNKDVRVWGQS